MSSATFIVSFQGSIKHFKKYLKTHLYLPFNRYVTKPKTNIISLWRLIMASKNYAAD